MAEMAGNIDVQQNPNAKTILKVVLDQLLKFIIYRSNVGVALDPNELYLFNRDKKNPPLEKELQTDLHRMLAMSPIHGVVQSEARDIGGGRVDILIKAKGISIVAELKRTWDDLNHAQLVDRFGAQAVSYQATNVTFGFLVVLDLRDRGGSQPHLREQVSVQKKRQKFSSTEYSVIVLRVQGFRKRPHEL
jgi:hypothetical protein